MTATFIDSHAHLDGPEFDEDRDACLERAREAGVEEIVLIGASGDISSAARAVALAQTDPRLWATIGVHPHDVMKIEPGWWDILRRLASDPRVVAIGETGLDYYYDHSPRDVQDQAFRDQIEFAREVGKPVVCHIRDAHAESRRILDEHHAVELGVVIHCFTGTPEDAVAYVEMGCYVSFSGIVSFKKSAALREAVAKVPLDRLLVETDCPYLAPAPKRGTRNEPAYVVHTARVVAEAAGVGLEELAARTVANTRTFFRLTAT